MLHEPCLYSQLDTLRKQKHSHVRKVRLQMTLLGLGRLTFGKAQGRRIRKGRACRGILEKRLRCRIGKLRTVHPVISGHADLPFFVHPVFVFFRGIYLYPPTIVRAHVKIP